MPNSRCFRSPSSRLWRALAPDRVHEIAAATVDPWLAPDAAQRLAEPVSTVSTQAVVQPWTELRPEMMDYAQLAKSWGFVVIFIVFAIAIFGAWRTRCCWGRSSVEGSSP